MVTLKLVLRIRIWQKSQYADGIQIWIHAQTNYYNRFSNNYTGQINQAFFSIYMEFPPTNQAFLCTLNCIV